MSNRYFFTKIMPLSEQSEQFMRTFIYRTRSEYDLRTIESNTKIDHGISQIPESQTSLFQSIIAKGKSAISVLPITFCQPTEERTGVCVLSNRCLNPLFYHGVGTITMNYGCIQLLSIFQMDNRSFKEVLIRTIFRPSVVPLLDV